ncbi:MAG: hypothetical protein ACK5A2_13400, partial [Bacteroidota bacterium]
MSELHQEVKKTGMPPAVPYIIGNEAAERFSFAALGDMPYRESHFPHFERLIARINAAAPAFTVHVGDFKNGVSFCDDDVYRRMRGLFDRFEAPLIYTPGDNEWTDCHRI